MKKPFMLLLCAAVLIVAACSKSTTKPTPVVTTPTNPYYFKFAIDGTSYDLKGDYPQYMPFNANEAGGYEGSANSLYPIAGVRLSWPIGHNVTDGDLMGLIGKTLYFNDTAIEVEVSFDTDINTPTWYSKDTSDKNFFVKITNVTFLKNDSLIGSPIKTYVLKGNCNAIVDQDLIGSKPSTFTGGDFNFIICRQDN